MNVFLLLSNVKEQTTDTHNNRKIAQIQHCQQVHTFMFSFIWRPRTVKNIHLVKIIKIYWLCRERTFCCDRNALFLVRNACYAGAHVFLNNSSNPLQTLWEIAFQKEKERNTCTGEQWWKLCNMKLKRLTRATSRVVFWAILRSFGFLKSGPKNH